MSLSASVALAKQAFSFVLDLLYPPCCGGCNRAGLGWWCAECDARTPWPADAACMASQPLGEGYPDLKVVSAARFDTPLREAIHRFKYEGRRQLATIFGVQMGALWARCSWPVDTIVPVPLHASRLRERGFNQSLLLAKEVSAINSLPIQAQALRRVRATQQQAQLNGPDARQTNVQGAFAAAQALVVGKAILLVDDVFTTGATLAACAVVLYQAGASEVVALTLARAETYPSSEEKACKSRS
jgi:competence protein ComFC